jgi:NAD(P)-dependent dehydrogenase (short-subunit alcohol dehydrogenase family)
MVTTKFILTGSSGGLGSSLIPKLSSLGSLDALYYNNAPIVADTPKVSGIRLDLLSNTAIKEYVDSLRLSSEDNLIFIHAATLNKDDLIVNLDSADLLDIFEVNLFSAINFAKALIPIMMANEKGQFIFLTSVVPKMRLVGTSAYSSSKIALEQFSSNLVAEYGRFGIRSNVIRLGYFEAGLIKTLPKSDSNKILKRIPGERFGAIENLNNAVDFIINSDYLNGSILDLDGGIS